MHRVILGVQDGILVDHCDGDGLNNQRFNLRPANQFQNQQNRGIDRNNTTGLKGVTWNKAAQKWYAFIGVNGKHTYLGGFDFKLEAGLAYDNAARELHGEFAWTNFEKGLTR